jgi:hypothetical protein
MPDENPLQRQSRLPQQESDGAFLLALVAGGFQVGELAQHMILGVLIDTLDANFWSQ